MTGDADTPATARDRLVGISCAVLSVLLFSSFTLVSRLGLSSSLTLPDLAALRFGIGGALLLPVVVGLMAYDSLAVASARQLLGDGFLQLASLPWSSYGVLSRRVGLPPATAAATVAVLSSAAFLPVYCGVARQGAPRRRRAGAAAPGHRAGALVGAVSIFVYTRAVAALGPAATALFAAAVPCVTTLAAEQRVRDCENGAARRRRAPTKA